MAIYEYKCERCGKKFFHLLNMFETDNDTACPKCRSRKVKRMVSASSFPVGSWSRDALQAAGK